VGPVLRLAYLNQPRGEFLRVAMRPISLYSGGLVAFTLGNDGARLLLIGGDGRSEVIAPGASSLGVYPTARRRVHKRRRDSEPQFRKLGQALARDGSRKEDVGIKDLPYAYSMRMPALSMIAFQVSSSRRVRAVSAGPS